MSTKTQGFKEKKANGTFSSRNCSVLCLSDLSTHSKKKKQSF